MNCNCKRDLGCYKSGIPQVGTNLVIPITICVEELKQGDRLEFFIPCCFDYPDCTTNVNLLVNGFTLLTLIKNGTVKSDQIQARKKYSVVIGTEFKTATVCNELPCSKYTYPEIDLTSSAMAVAETPVAKTSKKD